MSLSFDADHKNATLYDIKNAPSVLIQPPTEKQSAAFSLKRTTSPAISLPLPHCNCWCMLGVHIK